MLLLLHVLLPTVIDEAFYSISSTICYSFKFNEKSLIEFL